MPALSFDNLENRISHVRELVAHSPSVTELRLYAVEDVNVIDVLYRVERDEKGRIMTVVEALENGMWYWVSASVFRADLTCRDREYLVLSRQSLVYYYLLTSGDGWTVDCSIAPVR